MPYCPIKKRKTVYLDCLECEEKGCKNPPKKNPNPKTQEDIGLDSIGNEDEKERG